MFAATAWLFGPTLLLVPRLLFGAAMIVLFMIDLNERILPNVITLPGIVLGLAFSLIAPPGFRDALIGAVACSLALWGMGEAVSRALGKDALGFGDVKMVAMMGAFLGWKITLVALFMASLLGSVIGIAIVAIAIRRRRCRGCLLLGRWPVDGVDVARMLLDVSLGSVAATNKRLAGPRPAAGDLSRLSGRRRGPPTKISVSPGLIAPPAPRSPYAEVRRDRPADADRRPSCPATPWSQPEMTWPTPSRNDSGSPRLYDASNSSPVECATPT